MKFKKPVVVGVQVIPCEDWTLKDCIVKEGSIMNQIYEYAKQLEARINVMKSCPSCKHNTWETTLVCRKCMKKGIGKYSNWEFNPERIKEK